jgi:EmrB/QacA subfamily drug resistance transporter
VASLGVFMAFVDATVVNIAFPSIEHSFPRASLGLLSWVFNAYNVVFAAFLIPLGRLTDRVGRKRMFEAGIVLFTLASVACAGAPSAGVLIGARVLQGAAGAALVPASLAIVLAAYAIDRRAGAVGLWAASAALAAGLGPPLGGLLVQLSSWRLVFLVNLPIGVVALACSRVWITETREAPGPWPDMVSAGALGAAVALVALAIVDGGTWGWFGARFDGCLALAAVLLVFLASRTRRHARPLLDPSLLRLPAISFGNAMTILASTALYAILLCNVLFLVDVWNYSALRAGLVVAIPPVVTALVAGPAGRVVDRVGHRLVIILGALVYAAPCLWYIARIGSTPEFASVMLPGLVVSGIGAGIALPTLVSYSMQGAPPDRLATASSLNGAARQLGAVLGVALLVAVIGNPSPAQAVAAFHDGWLLAACCLFAVVAGCVLLGSRMQSATRRPMAAPVRPPAPVTPPIAAGMLASRERGGTGRLPSELANLCAGVWSLYRAVPAAAYRAFQALVHPKATKGAR